MRGSYFISNNHNTNPPHLIPSPLTDCRDAGLSDPPVINNGTVTVTELDQMYGTYYKGERSRNELSFCFTKYILSPLPLLRPPP